MILLERRVTPLTTKGFWNVYQFKCHFRAEIHFHSEKEMERVRQAGQRFTFTGESVLGVSRSRLKEHLNASYLSLFPLRDGRMVWASAREKRHILGLQI